MKTSLLPQMSIHRSCRIGTLVCCLTFLLASVRSGQGAFVQQAGTNQYNLYAFNGLSSVTDGLNPSAPWSGQPLPALTWFNIVAPWSGTIPSTGPVTVNFSSVTGSASFDLGANPTGAGGVTLTINNTTSIPDEVRLDWEATYVNTGGATPILAYAVNISGTMTGVGSYWELAGGETIYYANNVYTASTASIGGVPNLYWPAGAGPWIGALGPGSFTYTTAPMLFTPPLTILPAGTFVVQGYLDLIVDPGSVQVQIQAIEPPALGILTYSNSPVVMYPTAAGSNYVVQMATNLQTGNWVTVTNGVPFSGLQITNAPTPAFFRLQLQ